MTKEESQELIKYLVEKVTKGVKKQLKGYVRNTEKQIEDAMLRIKYQIESFDGLIKRTSNLRADWSALDMMIKEGRENKKLLLEMNELYNKTRNEVMDLNLLRIEIENNMRLNKKRPKKPI